MRLSSLENKTPQKKTHLNESLLLARHVMERNVSVPCSERVSRERVLDLFTMVLIRVSQSFGFFLQRQKNV